MQEGHAGVSEEGNVQIRVFPRVNGLKAPWVGVLEDHHPLMFFRDVYPLSDCALHEDLPRIMRRFHDGCWQSYHNDLISAITGMDDSFTLDVFVEPETRTILGRDDISILVMPEYTRIDATGNLPHLTFFLYTGRFSELVRERIANDFQEAMLLRGYAEPAPFEVAYCLKELVDNAHKHGNKGDFLKKISLAGLITDIGAALCVRDQGTGIKIDPKLVYNPEQDVDEYLKSREKAGLGAGGLGYATMMGIANRIDPSQERGMVRLVKYR